MNVFLIRHAEPEGAAGRGVGHTDLPLSASGVEMARGLAATWTGKARIVSSDLIRARCTAQAFGIDFLTDARLREMHFGQWDGLRFDEIASNDGERWQRFTDRFDSERAPGGESFVDVQARAVAALADLPAVAQHIVVCHAGVIRALLCHALDVPLKLAFRFRIDYASVTLLQLSEDRIDVCYVNADRFRAL